MSDDESLRVSFEVKPAPAKYTEKETLTWERELLGLYISAHPLDNYDAFFEEQTIPLSTVTPNIDGQKVTIGGIISTVRTIVTKSGKKMAFVGIEDKTNESELIIFPNLYEQISDQLAQDVVVKATGKISARDRDGNMGDEAKMIVDELSTVSDGDLQSYESTGRKMAVPAKRAPYRRKVSASASASKAPSVEYTPVIAEAPKTLYLRIDDPTDTDKLLSLKSVCSQHPGEAEVIMVIGEDKKALRLPFRVSVEAALTEKLADTIGQAAVVIK